MKNKSNGSGQSPSLNMISEGTKLKGDISSENDIRIAGYVDGEANSKGKLIITSSGHIEGNIKAVDSDIAGKIDGEIHVSNKLVLRQSAMVSGTIYTKTLLVEEGAQINGNCKMGAEPKKDSKKSEKVAAVEEKDKEKVTE